MHQHFASVMLRHGSCVVIVIFYTRHCLVAGCHRDHVMHDNGSCQKLAVSSGRVKKEECNNCTIICDIGSVRETELAGLSLQSGTLHLHLPITVFGKRVAMTSDFKLVRINVTTSVEDQNHSSHSY